VYVTEASALVGLLVATLFKNMLFESLTTGSSNNVYKFIKKSKNIFNAMDRGKSLQSDQNQHVHN